MRMCAAIASWCSSIDLAHVGVLVAARANSFTVRMLV
jgi:hypothetical protein